MSGKFAILELIKPLIVGIAIALVGLPLPGHAQSALRKIAIITSGSDKIYSDVTNSFAAQLSSDPPIEINLTRIEMAEGVTQREIADRIAGQDLVVTVGLAATKTIEELSPDTNTLAVLIPSQAFKLMLPAFSPNTPKHWTSAIVLDQPIERQLLLIKALFNSTKSVGILISSNSELSALDIDKLSKRLALDIHLEVVIPGANIFRELGFVLDKADIFLATPDPAIFNRETAGSILQSAYRHRVPVIGYANAHVKAGALSAVFSTPSQIGRQAAEFVLDYFANENMTVPTIQPPIYFSVAVNRQVERSLGMSLPNESSIHNAILLLENKAP